MKVSLIYSLMVLMSVNAFAAKSVKPAKAMKLVSAPVAAPQVETVQQPQIVEVVNDPVTTQSTNVNTTVTQPVVLQNQPTNQVFQQQPTNNVIIQKQPTTVVEESPLSDSRAEVLRKQRIDLEAQTESMIVEKLEAERMKAEQERARKLIEGLDTQKQDQTKAIETLQAPALIAAPVAAPTAGSQQQAVQVGGLQDSSVVIQQTQIEEVKATAVETTDTALPTIEVREELDKTLDQDDRKQRFFIGMDLGVTTYDLDNVSSTGSIGLTAGMVFDKKYIVEASYMYSRFDVESVDVYGYKDWYTGIYYPVITELRQHNFTSAFKYRILGDARFSPYAGGLVSFTYRDYDLIQDPYGYGSYSNMSSSSWAMDAGLIAGADLQLSENFAINADVRYIFNLTYDVQSEGFESSRLGDQFGKKIEEAGYWQVFVGSKFTF